MAGPGFHAGLRRLFPTPSLVSRRSPFVARVCNPRRRCVRTRTGFYSAPFRDRWQQGRTFLYSLQSPRMPVLTFEITLAAPLADVWAFHEDVAAALPALSPPAAAVKIESADLPVAVGSRIVITARGPLGVRLRWVARIVEHTPPDPAANAVRAAFVDEQESGPFAQWRHEHRFEQLAPGTSLLTDRVTYRVPLGPLGVIADRLFVRRQITDMFRHRHGVMERTFGQAKTTADRPAAGSITA